MDPDRSAQTISADPTWPTLRAEMNRVLDEMEVAHRSISDFPPELVKLGVALFLPLAGLPTRSQT